MVDSMIKTGYDIGGCDACPDGNLRYYPSVPLAEQLREIADEIGLYDYERNLKALPPCEGKRKSLEEIEQMVRALVVEIEGKK
jgi:hypothetical protein